MRVRLYGYEGSTLTLVYEHLLTQTLQVQASEKVSAGSIRDIYTRSLQKRYIYSQPYDPCWEHSHEAIPYVALWYNDVMTK